MYPDLSITSSDDACLASTSSSYIKHMNVTLPPRAGGHVVPFIADAHNIFPANSTDEFPMFHWYVSDACFASPTQRGRDWAELLVSPLDGAAGLQDCQQAARCRV
jgi:hypothetical protein